MKTCKATFLALSLFLLTCLGCQQNQSTAADVTEKQKEKIAQVSVEVVRPQEMAEVFTLPGSLEAWQDLYLSAELTGPIRWIGPEEGDRLIKGQEILKIDTDTLEADYERDRIAFEIKNRKLERYQKLIEQQLVSSQELDDLKYSVEEARADLRHSQLMLEKSTLKSPLAGVLDDLMVDRGEYVAAGQRLARIVQVDRLKVNVDVPEKDVSYLDVGSEVKIVGAVIDDRSASTKTGQIQYVAYTADPATRTYRATIVVDNKDGLFRPGKIVRAHFTRRILQQALSVPLYALVDKDGRKVIFVEEQGTARMVQVVTGAVIGKRVVIEEGLFAGDHVIVKGQQLIADGATVAVEED